MALYERSSSRVLDRPVLVVSLEGWVDAGLGAATAALTLLGSVETEVLGVFDGDELLDHRARRPMVRIDDGVNTGLTWPQIQVRGGSDGAAQDVAFLVGPEPDLRWHAFAGSVVDLAAEMGVRMMVGLGAFPAPVPHTRPVRLAATSTSAELSNQVGILKGTIEVPGGIEAALEQEMARADIPAVGLWARVPHYVAAMPFPAASVALIDGLARLTGLAVDSAVLHTSADEAARRVDALIAQSEEHTAMVQKLETSIDAAEGNPLDLGEMPSGDQIAAELERYLRGEGNG
jgi:proteasome assembly chaperone (PAC2) family protein